jgi:hypothetical protein
MEALGRFLDARYGEEERAVRDVLAWAEAPRDHLRPWHITPADPRIIAWGLTVVGAANTPVLAEHIARWNPARVLADSSAKRRIVVDALNEVRDARRRPGWTLPDEEVDAEGRAYRRGAENQKAEELPAVLDRVERLFRHLAQPYSGREDFRPEWLA